MQAAANRGGIRGRSGERKSSGRIGRRQASDARPQRAAPWRGDRGRAQVGRAQGQPTGRRLFRLTKGVPGAGGISRPSPEGSPGRRGPERGVRREQAGIDESGKAIGDRRKAGEKKAKDLEKRTRKEAAWLVRRTNDDIASEKARNAEKERDRRQAESEQKRRDAEGVRALEEEAKIAAKEGKDAPGLARARMADRLMAQGPGIVGEAFGPEAAQAASNATPAEVQAMRKETLENLKSGEMPYEAVLNAFREVWQASQRNAKDNARFSGQLRGFSGRAKSSTQSMMDTNY